MFAFKSLFFYSSFRFSEKLRDKFRESPPQTTHVYLPHYDIPIVHQRGTFITIDEPILIHHNHPRSIVYIEMLYILWVWTNV